MESTQLSCPHCGFSKEIPNEKLPQKKTSVRCHSCKETFVFTPQHHSEPQNSVPPVVEPVMSSSSHGSAPKDADSLRHSTRISLTGVFWRFVGYYFLGLVIVSILKSLFGNHLSSSSAGVIILIAAVGSAYSKFVIKNGRLFSREERRQALIGISLINLAIQTAFIGFFLLLRPLVLPGMFWAMTFFFVVILHPLLIWLTFVLREKMFKRQGIVSQA